MDFIHRKVFLSNDLIPYDSNSDGVNDTLIISKTDKIIQVPLTHRFNDIGLYDVYDDNTVTILDIVSVIDGNIDQSQIEQPNQPEDIIEINWGGGNMDEIKPDVVTVSYCTDTTKPFYAVLSSDDNFQYLTYPKKLNGNGESKVVTYTKDVNIIGTNDETVCTGDVVELEVSELEFGEGNSEFGTFGGNSCNGDCIYYGDDGYVTDEMLSDIINTVEIPDYCTNTAITNTIEKCFNTNDDSFTKHTLMYLAVI